MTRIYAQSISSALQLPLAATPLPLTCLSQHDHACNFQTSDGAIIALVTPRHGNGPFHVVLPQPLPLMFTRRSAIRATWQQGIIHIGALQIATQQARVWHPDLLVLCYLSTNASSWLYEVTARYQPSTLKNGAGTLQERARQGMDALQQGFTGADQNLVRTGALRLAGLGPGLTPAGDDFLVGLLAAIHASRLRTSVNQLMLCSLMAQTAAAQTTQLSAQWLRCAGQGHFGEPWHSLIAALNANSAAAITTAAHRILTTGATSGVDAMSGFLFGIRLIEDTRLETRN